MRILVDTNVWVHHFRRSDNELAHWLEEDLVLCHPIVIGEISMGALRRRGDLLITFFEMNQTKIATWEETHHLVEERRLYGRGIQWNDAQLLASALLSDVKLWTRDRRLHEIADTLGIAYYDQNGNKKR